MKSTTLIVIILIVVIGGLLLVTTPETDDTITLELQEQEESQAEAAQINVLLSEQNESGESGTATLTEVGGKVLVNLDLIGGPAFAQPAHIHNGSCDNLGGVQNPLTFPEDGTSITTLDLGIDELLTGLPLAINVHKSLEEAATYVACGDIVQ